MNSRTGIRGENLSNFARLWSLLDILGCLIGRIDGTKLEPTLRTAFGYLSNPHKQRDSKRLEDKRSLLNLILAKRLSYYRNEGFRTAAFSLPLWLLEDLKENSLKSNQKTLHAVSKLALREGVEVRRKSSNQNQKTLYVVSKLALREGVGPPGFEPGTYRL